MNTVKKSKKNTQKVSRKPRKPRVNPFFALERALRPVDAYGSPMWAPGKGPTDEQQHDARRVLRASYWTSVHATAQDIVDCIKSGEIPNAEGVEDALHVSCDGSYWVIYTDANYLAMLCSDHDETEDFEDSGEAFTPAIGAYYCLKADVAQQIEAILGCPVADYQHDPEGVSP